MILYSGKIINSIRKKYKFSMEKLAYGICGKSQFSRIENGTRHAEKLLFECIYHRMGKYTGRFELLLNSDEYENLEARWRISDYIDNEQYSCATDEVNRYKLHIDNNLHLQLMCLYECEIMHRTGIDFSQCIEKLQEGLQYTLPNFSFEQLESFFLGRTELYIIAQHARYIELNGDIDTAKNIYHRLLKYIEQERYDRSERGNHYRHIGYWLAKLYYSQHEYNNALAIAEKTYEEVINNDFWMFTVELKELIILCNKKLGNDMTNDKKYLDILQKMNKQYNIHSAETFFPRYIETRVYNVNTVLKQRRQLYGLSQEDLAGETGYASTISRMENSKQTLQYKNKVLMLQKVNMSGDEYIADVDTYDYAVFEQLNQLHDAINQENISEYSRILEDIKHNTKILNSLNTRQHFEIINTQLAFMQNIKSADILKSLDNILKETLNGIANHTYQNIFLLENEWQLISKLLIIYADMCDFKKSIDLLLPIAEMYFKNYKNDIFRCNELAFLCGDIIGDLGNLEEGNRYLYKGIDLCIKSDFLPWVPSYTYCLAWNILEKKKSISIQEKQLCIEQLEYAYALSDLYKNERRKQRIIDLCKKFSIFFS